MKQKYLAEDKSINELCTLHIRLVPRFIILYENKRTKYMDYCSALMNYFYGILVIYFTESFPNSYYFAGRNKIFLLLCIHLKNDFDLIRILYASLLIYVRKI